MQDSKKTKTQLIEELEKLRTRLAVLEKENGAESLAETSGSSRPLRRKLQAEIKFIGDFGLLEASGVNLSEGGICFEMEGEIPFELEFEIDGQVFEERANLVWMGQGEKSRRQLGFKFVPAEESETSGLLWLHKELNKLDKLNGDP
ncbi:MAG: hypothetical protein CME16_07245 [Gemmatimonadetes bacterium]|nr:hypothetical protein [Gemmatimonadota bacterium]